MPPDDARSLRRHDLVEELAVWGDVSMRTIVLQSESAESAWLMVQYLVKEQVATLWAIEEAPRGVEGVEERALELWEVVRIARTHLSHSHESNVRLERLILRAGPRINDARRHELGF